jgi:hypothetical protein
MLCLFRLCCADDSLFNDRETRDFSSIFGERIWKLEIVKYSLSCSEIGDSSKDFRWET